MFDRIIKSGEAMIVGVLLSKLLSERNVKKIADQVGESLDSSLDKRYGGKSEKLQGRLCLKVKLFSDLLIAKLKEDWKKPIGKKK